jgi:tryptophan synthase alpha chain
VALSNGVGIDWILGELEAVRRDGGAGGLRTPRLIMSYLNPLLSVLRRGLGSACAAAGVSACIIPDLPIEEAGPIRADLHKHGVGLVQLVSPVTPAERAKRLAEMSDGFVYAVMVTGVTGGHGRDARATGGEHGLEARAPRNGGAPRESAAAYLKRLKSVSPVPVCAGFGIRGREQVAALRGVCDGAIVGSALIEAIERGEDAGAFVRSLV